MHFEPIIPQEPETPTPPSIPIPAGKTYKDYVVYLSTVLGGPLAGAYMIFSNYRVFNDKNKAMFTWLWAAALIAGISLLYSLFPYEYKGFFLSVFIALFYALIPFYAANYYQGKQIKNHLSFGGQTKSTGNIVLVVVICGILSAVVFLLIFSFTSPQAKYPAVKNFGQNADLISFNEKNISPLEIDSIGMAFVQVGFFDRPKKHLFVKKVDNSYEIIFPCFQRTVEASDFDSYTTNLRNKIQEIMPNHKIVFVIVIGTIDNVYERLE